MNWLARFVKVVWGCTPRHEFWALWCSLGETEEIDGPMLCSGGSTVSSSSSEVSRARVKRTRVGALRLVEIHLHQEQDRAKPRVDRENQFGGNLLVVKLSLAREPGWISCTISHLYPTSLHIVFGALSPRGGYRATNGTRASIYAISWMPTSQNPPSTHSGE
jgi:hypothetical protein